jgi:hypothetical protein
MEVRDKQNFGVLIQGLAANFRAEMSDAQVAIMWLGLGDLSLGEMETATRRALLECRFMPTVAELRERCGRHSKLRIVDGKPWTWLKETGWGRYWGSVQDAARSVGEPGPALPALDRRLRLLPRERDE